MEQAKSTTFHSGLQMSGGRGTGDGRVHSEKWTENSSDSCLPDRHLVIPSGKWKQEGKQKSGQGIPR